MNTENTTNETNQANTTPAVAMLDQLIAFALQMKKEMEKIPVLEEKMEAMMSANNQLADMAFDENRFTQELLERCENAAREAAEESINIDEIVGEVHINLDISEDVHRIVDRMDFVDENRVEEIVSNKLSDEDFQTESQVEDLIINFLHDNDYITRDDTEDVVQDVVNEMVDERTENVARRIAQESLTGVKEEITQAVIAAIINKLTGKETHHADNSNHNSVSISGVIGQSEIQSNGQTLS